MSRSIVIAILSATLGVAACSIDAVLEGTQPPAPIRVRLTLESSTLTVAPGDSATLIVSALRLDGSKGKLTFSVSVPPQFDATIANVTESGAVTTATITIRAGASLVPASYFANIRVDGEPAGGASASLSLNVAPRPRIGVAPVKQTASVIPGGIAPIVVSVVRTAFTGPVALTLVAPPGISLVAPNEPVGGSSATVTLAVGGAVAPGTYAVTLRGSAPGVPDSDAPLSIIVSADALQLIVDDMATPQATVVSRDVIVNRNGASGAVTLSADGLPAGVGFSATTATGSTATLTLVVTAGALPGSHLITLRGSDGANAASVSFVLAIAASNVAMTLVPQHVAVLQGSTAASVLTLVRNSFGGAVSVELSGVPAGITVNATDATVTGATTTLVVTVARDKEPGPYLLTVRAIPHPSSGGAGGPALDPVTASLTVTVVETSTSGANVVLDWSRCSAPDWVAGQDGTGPWTRLSGAQGRFAFAVSSVRGGVAYSTGPRSLTVQLATNAELTAAPTDMCDPVEPVVPLRTVTGLMDFSTILTSSSYTWRLGGGVGTSTLGSSDLTITGVRPGVHDLIGTGTIGLGNGPIVIVRDVNPPPDGYIGTVPVLGEFAIAPISGQVSVGPRAAESVLVRESYLTTAACTANEIYLSGTPVIATGTSTFGLLGIPESRRRSSDYHHLDVRATSAAGTRSASLSVHAVAADKTLAVALPPNLPSYSVTQLPGSHLRLRLSMDAIPTGYNGAMTLQFGDGLSSVTIVNSAAALATAGTGIFLLDMPDLGGTSGFPDDAVPPVNARGDWTLTLTGSTGHATDCAEGASRWSIARTGSY